MHPLEQAILDSDDEADRAMAWAILADHLQQSGDERGRLWALDRALDDDARDLDARLPLIHQRNRIHSAHVGEWLGPLIAQLDRDPTHPDAYAGELSALGAGRISWSQLRYLPRLFHQQEPSVQLAWNAGFVTAARIRGHGERVAQVAAALLKCPATSLLTCLDIACDDLTAGTRSIRADGRLARVRRLRLRATATTPFVVTWLADSAPNLHELSITDGDFVRLSHSHLRALQCAGQRAERVLSSLGWASLPALERLHIGPFASIGDRPDLRVLGESTGLPALRTLRLGRLPVEVEELLLATLIDSPLMARIARLEVEWLNDRPDTRDWLDAHRSQLARVVVSDIREYSELFCPGL